MAAEKYSQSGVAGITVWRDALQGRDPQKSGDLLRAKGLEIVSYCRGGFFPNSEVSGRKMSVEDNKKTIDEAAALVAHMVVLVCGAETKQSLE